MTLTLENDESIKASTDIIKVKKKLVQEKKKTILFLGDSLINENIYTNCVKRTIRK